MKEKPEKTVREVNLIPFPYITNIGIKRLTHPALDAANITSIEIENIRRIFKISLILLLLSKNIEANENGHIIFNQATR